MKRLIKLKLILLCAWIVACGAGASASAEGVPYARDLAKDGIDAAARQAVVLIAFVGADCPYCETLMREFLVPISRNADYQARLVLRRIEMGGQMRLRDFSGAFIEHGDFAARHGIRFVPTIMVFDSLGHPLAKPLVGLRTIDYYGADLDETIDEAVAKLHARQGMKGPSRP